MSNYQTGTKMLKVIDSCKTSEQLITADNYVGLVAKRTLNAEITLKGVEALILKNETIYVNDQIQRIKAATSCGGHREDPILGH